MIYKVKGILYYTDHATIEKVFGKTFKGITVKPRIFGFEVKYEDSKTELFITTTDNSEKEYFVDISFTGDNGDFDLIKDALKKEIMEQDILFDLSFIIEDDNGNELEERFIHPDFSNRFIPPY